MENYCFKLTQEDQSLVASFGGRISTQRYSEFRNDYNEVCRRLDSDKIPYLIIDLSDAEYFGSLFIGMIVKLTVNMGNRDGKVALCGLSDQLMELLKKLLLLERAPDSKIQLKHYATLQEALAALSS